MHRSRLESCEAILEALIKKPLTVGNVAYRTNMDCPITKRHMDFLQKNELVEERILGNRTLCAITERGVTVFKTLNFQKYIERISNTLMAIDEAMETIPIISKRSQELGKH
jgi:predicted transcriptional regulator